jgi:outer membrane protein
MRKSTLSAIVLGLALTGSLSAIELSLEEAVAMAGQNNRTIQLARLDVESAQADKTAAYATAFPKVSASAGLAHEFLDQPEISPFPPDNSFQVGVTLNQTLFDLRVLYAITASQALNRFTGYRYEATRQQSITAVKKSFYAALLAREVFRVAQSSEASARENYENVKKRYESGVVSEYDLLQAEVNWRNTIPDRTKARRDYELALNSLKALIGLPQEQQLELTGTLDSYPAMPEAGDFEKLLRQRPDIQALEWQKKLQEINLRAQASAYYPSLSATMSYTDTANSEKLKWENGLDSLSLGLLLSVPVFTGGNTRSTVRKAETEVDRVTVLLAQTREQILVQMSNIRLRLEEAGERIESAEKNVSTARRAFEIAETRVQNQLATQVELNASRVSLDLAQVNYYSAIYDYLAAYFDWQQATGMVAAEGT